MTPHIREVQHPDGTRRFRPFNSFEAAKAKAIDLCLLEANMQGSRGYETAAEDLTALAEDMNHETKPFTLRAAAYTLKVYPGTINNTTYNVET